MNAVFLVILFCREIRELLSAGWAYFTLSLQNYFQLVVLILSTVFIVLAPKNMEVANHFGAWAVFFAWANVTRFLAMTDNVGQFIGMAYDLIEKLVKTFLIFTPSFIAFVFTLNMLLQSNPHFYDVPATTLKIFSMMIGEFGYDDNFSQNKVAEQGGRNYSAQVILRCT